MVPLCPPNALRHAACRRSRSGCGAARSRRHGWLRSRRLVGLPEQLLVTHLLVDDAFYYAVPARNLLAGLGYSFDGLEPTNGVQTLWAFS